MVSALCGSAFQISPRIGANASTLQTLNLPTRFHEDPEEKKYRCGNLNVLGNITLLYMAAMHATTTIPIVFGSMQDPIEKGVVVSLAHPGGNVTGNALIADHFTVWRGCRSALCALPALGTTISVYTRLPRRKGLSPE